MVDRATLTQSRADDLVYVEDSQYLDFLSIFFANVITKLGKKLALRQRVIATAIVFFRRFYLKNSYCDTEPFIVLATCCYVAAKAEETPVHIKTVVSEARMLFHSENYGVKNFPSDNSRLAEMEFYLVGDIECDLVIFHPYRTLMTLCRSVEGEELPQHVEAEAGEVGVGEEGPKYWATSQGQLELPTPALQRAWFIINDSFRSELCLLYPPHLIAITAIYLTIVLYPSVRSGIPDSPSSTFYAPTPQHRNSSTTPTKQDPVDFLAGLNVSMPLVATIAQEMISTYTLWERYKEDVPPDSARNAFQTHHHSSGAKRNSRDMQRGTVGSTYGGAQSDELYERGDITPLFLVQLLARMRQERASDVSHPPGGRPVAVNRMLERTQAAG